MNVRTTGKHGNQATYDIDGKLITSGVAAGSADYKDAVGNNSGHQDYDVDTFNLAVELDDYSFETIAGIKAYPLNIDPNGDNKNIDKYFEVRPAISSN